MNWKKILKEERNKSITEQQDNREQIIEAFREMWKTKPTEQQFSKYVSGLVLFPECLYMMVKEIDKTKNRLL